MKYGYETVAYQSVHVMTSRSSPMTSTTSSWNFLFISPFHLTILIARHILFLLIRFKIIYMYITNISHTKIPNFLRVFSNISRQLESLVSLLFTANVVLRISFLPYRARLPPSHILYGMAIAILIPTIR